MDAVSQEVMKKIDTYTCEHLIKSIDLMEAAGTSMAKEVLSHYSPKRVLLLVGSSGNGGDALVLGRKLIEEGIMVDAYLISDRLSMDANINKERFKGNIYYELPHVFIIRNSFKKSKILFKIRRVIWNVKNVWYSG